MHRGVKFPDELFLVLINISQEMNTKIGSRKGNWNKSEEIKCFHESRTDDSSSPDESSGGKCYFKQKSELCKKFMEKGFCPYGVKCKFAHGSQELRQNNGINGKYKTKECTAYFRSFHCKYGERCNFLHTQKRDHEEKDGKGLHYFLMNYPEMVRQLKTRQKSRVIGSSQ